MSDNIIPTETDKAWMAGFVDGEGCITISKQIRKTRPSPSYRVMVTISNTYKPVLEYFTQVYGGNIYHIHERRKDKQNVKWADAYDWYCPIGSAARFLNDILPYLRIKQKQAKICLDFLANKTNTQRSIRGESLLSGSEGLTQEELDRREEWRIAVQQLNSKGKRSRSLLSGDNT